MMAHVLASILAFLCMVINLEAGWGKKGWFGRSREVRHEHSFCIDSRGMLRKSYLIGFGDLPTGRLCDFALDLICDLVGDPRSWSAEIDSKHAYTRKQVYQAIEKTLAQRIDSSPDGIQVGALMAIMQFIRASAESGDFQQFRLVRDTVEELNKEQPRETCLALLKEVLATQPAEPLVTAGPLSLEIVAAPAGASENSSAHCVVPGTMVVRSLLDVFRCSTPASPTALGKPLVLDNDQSEASRMLLAVPVRLVAASRDQPVQQLQIEDALHVGGDETVERVVDAAERVEDHDIVVQVATDVQVPDEYCGDVVILKELEDDEVGASEDGVQVDTSRVSCAMPTSLVGCFAGVLVAVVGFDVVIRGRRSLPVLLCEKVKEFFKKKEMPNSNS